MFTGIVEELAEVVSVQPRGDVTRVRIHAPDVAAEARVGDSIAVNGVCLTVTEPVGQTFVADVVGETLDRSNLGALRPGSPVNLERPLTLTSRLGGHLVQGHVDGTGQIVARQPSGANDSSANDGGTNDTGEHRWELVRFSLPGALEHYLIPKGSVAVDGISLTVVDVGDGTFTAGLVPATLERTTLGHPNSAEAVNLEVDMIAKYVDRHVEKYVRRYLEQYPEQEPRQGAADTPATHATEGGP